MARNATFLNDESLVDYVVNRIKFFNRIVRVSKNPSPNLAIHLQQLRKDGYVVLNELLDSEELQKIQKLYRLELEEKANFEVPCLAQTKISAVKHKDMIDSNLRYSVDEMKKRGITFDKSEYHGYQDAIEKFRPSTLKTYIPQSKAFFDLWLNPYLLDLIEAYMGIRPYMTEAYLRRNFKADYKVMNHYWHRDNNHPFHLLKAFFFFSDCELLNGPHEYIAGSLRDKRLNGKTYYSDEEVDKLYPEGSENRIRSIVKAGTIILEDTRGLHRAMVPESGQRDLGYAVYYPIRFKGKLDKKYYHVSKEIHAQLNDRQKSYILPANIESRATGNAA